MTLKSWSQWVSYKALLKQRISIKNQINLCKLIHENIYPFLEMVKMHHSKSV
jgi:hypothetical protein